MSMNWDEVAELIEIEFDDDDSEHAYERSVKMAIEQLAAEGEIVAAEALFRVHGRYWRRIKGIDQP